MCTKYSGAPRTGILDARGRPLLSYSLQLGRLAAVVASEPVPSVLLFEVAEPTVPLLADELEEAPELTLFLGLFSSI
jgi:hypothetical protein